jgi:ferritin-like metal-binding protein YciE
MSKTPKTLDDLFHETLKDIYYAEKKILTALPKMAKAAQSEDLQAAFEKHEGETEGQVARLERVFAMIDQPAKGKTCDAINGLIDESTEVTKEFKGSPALDAGLLAELTPLFCRPAILPEWHCMAIWQRKRCGHMNARVT